MSLYFSEIELAKTDEEALSCLVKKNRKFLLASAFGTCGRYIGVSDDEYSVALAAFIEAVRAYDGAKGNFRSFASAVIRRRLIDYQRAEKKYANETAVANEVLDGQIEEDCGAFENEVRLRLAQTSLNSEETKLKAEIEDIQQTLRRYGFSFYDLTRCSPKAGKTRKICAAMVRYLCSEPELIAKMRKTGSLPVQAVCENTKAHRKTAERHRKYIIAAVEIISGDYPYLKEWLPEEMKGDQS
jgi:RNA polymerase sigma factor